MTDNAIPFIEAHNLALKSFGHTLYRDVGLQAFRGRVLAIHGGNGSGKTPLLLTLAGRMKPTSGTLRVGGLTLPQQRVKAMRHVGLALFEGANDLPDNLYVEDAVLMEFELYNRRRRRCDIESYLDDWGLLQKRRTRVRFLSARDKCLLGIALAFAGNPDAVVVDDVESRLTLFESKGLMALLAQQAVQRNAAIVVGVVEGMLARAAHDRVNLPVQKAGE